MFKVLPVGTEISLSKKICEKTVPTLKIYFSSSAILHLEFTTIGEIFIDILTPSTQFLVDLNLSRTILFLLSFINEVNWILLFTVLPRITYFVKY